MVILIFLLSGLLIISTSIIFYRNKQIESLAKKIKKINESNTNEIITISSPNKNIENLAFEINNILKSKRDMECKYKELDLELRQAIANISHDLRTPLTSIMGYIQLLKDENISKDDKKEYINIVEKRSYVLKNLISSFYDLSRLQASEYDLELEKVNLHDILCEIIAAFYNDIENKGLEPVVEIEESNSLVLGDKIAINRIFTNLIQNILKYGKGRVKIVLKEEKDYIVTAFSNEENEIKEDEVNRIFERFFTGDRMRTGQNTGLGLAITKILVEEQGNKIFAEKKDNILTIKILWKKIYPIE
ncbi:sensor histidine kinase [Eubacterium multiforme]|uniref:histidine kinase n=1 Tax=Eubacterium multiforme TaxID=83339 RepID=A0ABT9UY19_9FIRM|nr:HAMP domain-containing sensor histidine kinase [Eubacterium multiforme]MDQ0151196.1 signal transduction histidine kinase [Eubacterium multiforme]